MENHEHLLEEKVIIVPTREHKSLEIFLGKWAIEGQNSNEKSEQPSCKILGIETYEWLHGGFFLI